MIIVNFDPSYLAKELTANWKAYYSKSYTNLVKSFYNTLKHLTGSTLVSIIASVFVAMACLIFGISKNGKRKYRRAIVLVTAVSAMVFLKINFQKAKRIGRLFYSWNHIDRKLKGKLSPKRDEAQALLMAEIFNGNPEQYINHAIIFSEAEVLLDPFEFNEVPCGPWDKVEKKLLQSLMLLKSELKKNNNIK